MITLLLYQFVSFCFLPSDSKGIYYVCADEKSVIYGVKM